MNRTVKTIVFIILASGFFRTHIATAAEKPNIILIFTDDQGYQDLGCFGSKTIKTPHLDQMAAEGVRLTSFYAQPVCGVSRAALMTGSYPIRIAEPGNVKRLHTVPHPKEVTMAEVLKRAGYATGMIGKWHLAVDRKDLPSGVGPATMPNAQGFDYFYGTPKYNGFTVYVDDHKMRSTIMRDQKVVVEAVESWDNITADYTAEAIKWIKANTEKETGKPFFLYLAHNMPHIPLGASEKFKGKSEGGFYGDTIEEIDWSCGEIFKTLKQLDIDDNTLVIFTSDNGPWVETTRGMEPDGEAFIPRDHSGNVEPLRGWKMSAWDGGSRVPFIARWPGEIPAGWESDELLSTMDLLPTFASIAGAKLPDAELDGSDATSFLTQKTKVSPRDEYLYYSGCLLTGVRSGQWKLVLPREKAPEGLGWWGRMIEAVPEILLFNLDNDPGETTNVAADNLGVVASLMKRIERARTELGDIDRIGSGARLFDKGPRKLQVPIKKKVVEAKAAVVEPAKLYRDTIPQDKKLDPEWAESLTERGHPLDRGIRGTKKDDTLKYIGMPVGGIGCGTVYLSGDGRLYVWDIWNKGQRGVIAQNIDVPEGFPNFRDKPKVDVVNGSNFLNPPTFEKFPPEFAQGFGLKLADGPLQKFQQADWESVEFTGNWPMGKVAYRDSNKPVSATLQAYSPFVPLDLNASTIPVTVMKYTLTNDSAEVVSAELVGWLANMSNTPRSRPLGRFKVRPNLTTVHHQCRMQVPPFIQGKRRIEPDKPFHDGSMTLSLLGEGTSATVDKAPGIASAVTLKPGESREITFLISWHFPDVRIREEFGPATVPMTNAYTQRFDNSLEVANYVAMNRKPLFSDTEQWVTTWNDSTLPQWLLDRTMATADTLQSANCFLLDDGSNHGRFWAWEGVGVCHGTCTHVWYYAQTMARLFPSLERNLREKTDFKLAMLPDGGVPFRIKLGRGSKVAIDGQCGTVLRSYREHLTSTDSTFLKTNWPHIKRAAQYLINFDRNDGNFDGLLEGEQHNTLDAEWYGKVHALTSPYLATLRACEEMASQVGDEEFQELCRSTYKKGRNNIETLFNGEYYVQLEDPNHPEAIGVGKGVYIDQVIGQFWANQLGLGRLYNEDHIKSALRSIWKYNFVPDVASFRNTFREGRFYAWDGDAGLLMCTWPNGGLRDDFTKHWQYAYFNESMTGFEYQVSAHMVAERDADLVTKGLAIARSIHDRYSPAKRNPYNEIECSDHYSRAMSSYAVFLAACGFQYDGPAKTIGFDPVIHPEHFKAAFTAAEGWGTFEQRLKPENITAELSIKWGNVAIETLQLSPRGFDASDVNATLAGRDVETKLVRNDDGVSVRFVVPAEVSAGESLRVVVSGAAQASQAEKQPNFVVIFTDDQGYGDLSCFGGEHVATPRIDRMAAEGTKLTSFYVAAPVCTPSRAALMTGCYPKRVNMAIGSNFPVLLSGDSKGLNPDEITIAEVLKTAGYQTGMFGKWHLGDQPPFLPTRQGFDEFFGLPYSHDIHPFNPKDGKTRFSPLPLLDGETVIEMEPDADYLTKRITDRAVTFIEKHKDEPFFLYVPHPIPHRPVHVSPPFMKGVDAEIANKLQLEQDSIDYRARDKLFRQAIAEIDWSVGQILDALKTHGIDENTFVIFTSDNGPAIGSAGPLRGRKGSTFEGGMRESTVVRWPGKIPAGKSNGELVTAMDLLPTFARLAGAELPTDRVIDGKDVWPVLTGKAKSPHKAFFYHRRDDLTAVRSGNWKLHVKAGKPFLLYDLATDIGETKNLVRSRPEIVEPLMEHLTAFALDIENNSRPAAFVDHAKPLRK